jgi:hypothetical protein
LCLKQWDDILFNSSLFLLRFGEGGKGVGDEITQQTLLPEVRDPNLWIVKCRIGEEKVSQP